MYSGISYSFKKFCLSYSFIMNNNITIKYSNNKYILYNIILLIINIRLNLMIHVKDLKIYKQYHI